MTTPESTKPSRSLTSLVLAVTRRPEHMWPELTDRASVIAVIETALGNGQELRFLAACYPDPVLRAFRLRRFGQAFAIPDALIGTLLARLDALPPRTPAPLTPEIADWAWERRRELFGRHGP